jgi:hypothetical protein
MKKWTDPVKNRPAKDETLATRGDFAEFTENMRKLMKVKPHRDPLPPSLLLPPGRVIDAR